MAKGTTKEFRIEQLKAEWLGLQEKAENLCATKENERGLVRMEKAKISERLVEIENQLRALVSAEGA